MERRFEDLIQDLNNESEEVRKDAIVWLSQIGGETALPPLRALVQDPSTGVRHFARRAIDAIEARLRIDSGVENHQDTGSFEPGQVEDAGGFEPGQVEEYLLSPDRGERLAAARVLEHSSGEEAHRLASERLAVESDPEIQTVFLGILGTFRDNKDLGLILSLLEHENALVRGEAVNALEGFYHPSIPGHLTALVDDPDNRTRANVLLILGRYDEGKAMGPLIEMSRRPEVWMKDSAIHVAKNLSTPRCVELLGEMYRRNRSDSYLEPKISAALKELADRGDRTAQEILEQPSGPISEQERTRIDLETVLDSIEKELREGVDPREKRVRRTVVGNLEEFYAALADPEYERRLSAVEAGVRLDRTAAARAFRERLEIETHPFVLSKLAKELGYAGGSDDIPVIAKMLKHPDGRVRANAIEGLGQIGGPGIHDLVKALLEDPVPRVRANAARIVSRIDREQAFSTLKDMIVSEAAGVSESAIHAIGEVWTDDVLDLLELALGKENQEVKIRIFKVLAHLSTKSSLAARIYSRYRTEGDSLLVSQGDVEAMLRIVQDPDPAQRLQGLEGLKTCPDSRAPAAIERAATRDKDLKVRKRAQEALRTRDLEVERTEIHYSVGAVLYRRWRQGTFTSSDLALGFRDIEDKSRALDFGGNLDEGLIRRNLAVADVGKRALAYHQDGCLDLAFGGDEIVEKAARNVQIDRLIRERLAELETERLKGIEAGDGAEAVAPLLADTPAAEVGSWVSQNRGVAVAMGVLMTTLCLGLLAHYFGRSQGGVGWSLEVPGVTTLLPCGLELVAMDSDGGLVSLEASTGRLSWKFNLTAMDKPFAPCTNGRGVFLSSPEGRIVAVSMRTGRRLWIADIVGLSGPPSIESGLLYALGRGSVPTLHGIDPETGKVRLTKPVEPDVQAIQAFEGGVLLARTRMVSMFVPKMERLAWECPLPSDLSKTVQPFEMGGILVVCLKDRVVGIGKDGRQLWETMLGEGQSLLRTSMGRKEFVILAGKEVQIIGADGKAGGRAALRSDATLVRAGRSEICSSNAQGEVFVLSFKDRVDRYVSKVKRGPVLDLVKIGATLYAAAGGRVEAMPVPRR